MALGLGLPNAHIRSAEQQREVREAKRLLKERIRDDWDYPPLPAHQSSGRSETADEGQVAGSRSHTPSNHDRGVSKNVLGFEPVEWREREYSSASESDEESAVTVSSKDSEKSKSSEYKFEGPDSVGPQLQGRRLARKRKRQKALDEEMGWNDGLQHWMSRRDLWCGAHTTLQVQTLDSRRELSLASDSASAVSSPRTSTSSAGTSVSVGASSSPLSPPEGLVSITLTLSPSTPHNDILIPVVPRILANHPVRRRIDPKMHPEIYSKIILQARTPSVPINLTALMKALVQGWKDNGEWPPKQGVLEKPVARKKGGGRGFAEGVKAVGRVLKITVGESGGVGRDGRGNDGG